MIDVDALSAWIINDFNDDTGSFLNTEEMREALKQFLRVAEIEMAHRNQHIAYVDDCGFCEKAVWSGT